MKTDAIYSMLRALTSSWKKNITLNKPPKSVIQAIAMIVATQIPKIQAFVSLAHTVSISLTVMVRNLAIPIVPMNLKMQQPAFSGR